MHEIAKQNLGVSRTILSRKEAIDLFKKQGEHYKVEIIKDLPEKIENNIYLY